MKNTIVLFLVVFIHSILNAQVPNRGCGTPAPGPQYDSAFQNQVIQFLNLQAVTKPQTTYQVPVIVHVIHGGQAIGTFPNLAQGQINSQIQVLNEDYSSIGFGSANYPATAFQIYASNTVISTGSKDGSGRIGIANTGISFCLALKDSVGTNLSEPGIERLHWNSISGASDPVSFSSSSTFMSHFNNVIKPATIWNPSKYLNIWISDVNGAAGLLGFTFFPPLSGLTGISGTGTATTDGLWCWAKVFGSQNIFPSGVYSAPYNYGRTATHELSHYFGVRHTWGDASCATDYCNDTPPQQNYTFGTPSYPHLPYDCPTNSPPTGSEGIMFMNFADYTDDVGMYMFTDEQKIRIQTAMLNSPYRKFLGTHGLCSPAGATVVANFSLSSSVISTGQTVSITDLSTTSSPPIFSWTYFSPASTVTTSTLQNPSFTFTTPGVHTISLTVSSAGVNASTSKTIQVNACPLVSANINNMNPSCSGACDGSITLTANGGPPFTYSWTPAVSSSSVASSLCAGLYTCVITNSCGLSVTKTFTLSTPPAMTVSINSNTVTVCNGQPVNLSSTVNGGTPSYVYSWSTGSSSSSIVVTPTNTPVHSFSLTVTDSQGCSSIKTISVNVNPRPTVAISSPSTNVCFGYTMSITASGAGSYQWSTGSLSSSIVIQPISATVYSVVGTNGFGCSDTAYLSISILPLPSVVASASSTLVCNGESVALTASGNAVTYYWQPLGVFNPNPVPQISSPTTFTLLGQGTNGCGNFSTVFVNVKSGSEVIPVVTPSVVCAGDSVRLSVLDGSVPSWSMNPVSNSMTLFPLSNSTYSVQAIDTGGCLKEVFFNISFNPECEVAVYTVITANGDGLNDYLVIDNIEKFRDNKVTVFNRWGNKVFSTVNYDNYSNHWDGKSNGKAMDSGTYFYIIEINAGTKKGWVELVAGK
ncbi:MAG: hypothetical protein K0R26_1339 [Bacteroidota bacterium]|jgi:gliding motility-associated-like protein|nr:hypothetical protein [Bacteroidota bacterium]